MHTVLAILVALILWTYYAIELGRWIGAKRGDRELRNELRDARETIRKLMEK